MDYLALQHFRREIIFVTWFASDECSSGELCKKRFSIYIHAYIFYVYLIHIGRFELEWWR